MSLRHRALASACPAPCRWSRWFSLLSLCLVPRLAMAQPSPAIDRIMVMPVVVSGGLDARKAELLNEAFLADLMRVVPATTKLVGTSDVAAMLGKAEQARLMNCDDSACLVEIGNALGASHMIASSLGLVGGRYLLTCKLLNVNQGTVLYRGTLYLGASEEELVAGMQRMADDMAAQMQWRGAAAASNPTGPTSPGILPWIGGGALAVGLVGAAAAGGAVLWAESQAGDGAKSWDEKQGAARLGGLALLGLTAGGLMALAGGGLLTWALLGGAL